jgi:hypothetical protein
MPAASPLASNSTSIAVTIATPASSLVKDFIVACS